MMYDLGVIELSVTLAGQNPILLGILTLSFCLQVEMEAVTIVGFSCFIFLAYSSIYNLIGINHSCAL